MNALPSALAIGLPVLLLVLVYLLARRQRGGTASRIDQERRQAQRMLRESQNSLGFLMEEMKGYAIFQTDPEGRVSSWNPGAERLFGWRPEEILGRSTAALYCPEDVQAGLPAQDLDRARACGTIHEERWRLRKDGGRFRASVSLSTVQDGQGRVIGFMRITQDLTERLQAEARLQDQARDLTAQVAVRTAEWQESEARIRGFIRHAPAAIAVKGLDGRLLMVNRRAEALIGKCQATTPADSGSRVLPPDLLARGREQDAWVLAHREELQTEESVTLADGSSRDFLLQKFPLIDGIGHCWGLGVIATNITQHKRLEQAQLRHQKLESLGLLAGGVAHDFNNILSAMVGNLDLARLELGPLEHLQILQELAARAAELVAQILACAGRGPVRLQPLDLNQLLEEVARLLRASLPESVVLEVRPMAGLPALEGDPGQIRQVLLNLVANAAEAIEAPGGVIRIASGSEQVSQAAIDAGYPGQGLAPGPHLVLEVSDDGPGIAGEIKERIFDPFFTTKFTGRGLGLAAVQGILRSHRGAVRVLSEEGKGCTFKVLLPAAEGAREPAAEPEAAATPFRSEATVLVVDDEDAVRAVAVRLLRRLGMETVEARDGLEALVAYEAHWERIRLILLDLTMPRMGGEETYRELRRAGAMAPIILSSGFGPEEALLRFRGMALAGFLQKPYRLQTLTDTVRRALEGMDSTAGPRGNPPRELVAWIPEFELGHPLMDTQHKGLVRAFNHLVACTEDGPERPARPQKALALLIEALAAHADSEERLMAEAGYTGAAEHAASHAGILGQVREVAQRIQRGAAGFTPEVLDFVEDLMLNHIQLDDMEMGRGLGGDGAGPAR